MDFTSASCRLEEDGTWTTKVGFTVNQRRGSDTLHVYERHHDTYEDGMRYLLTIAVSMEAADATSLQE